MSSPSDNKGSHIKASIGVGGLTIELSRRADSIHLEPPSLRDRVTNRVLNLFSISLVLTLAFAAALLAIDAWFIYNKIIVPEQRLMTEKVVMTFITATVVQVGTALAAIVFAVFKVPQNNASTIDGS